jgi:cytochrome P450
MRRTKEFDKPDLISDIFYGIAPEFHAVKVTSDAWRNQRKLLQDLMAPAFLNGVAAPQLHQSFMDMVKLWSEKLRLGEGRPFAVKHDIFDTALDAIWSAVFGNEGTATVTRNQNNLLSELKNIELPSSVDQAVEFPKVPAPPQFRAVLELTDSIEACTKSPFPRTTGFIQRYLPSGRKNLRIKAQFTAEEIAKAETRMRESEGKEANITNAVDHMLRREKLAAEKLNRAPQYQSKVMYDELMGLLIAGHDTTSTTLSWTVKFLATHQDVQTRLRSELHSSFAAAHAENRVPTAQEVAACQNHYLDAVIEEINRLSTTGGIVSRTAMTDAVVLGNVIPKGTKVLLLGYGGGILEPAHKIDDRLRSEQYHKADGGKTGTWAAEGMREFDPERWLVRDKESGEKVFDAQAGPHMSFGGGLRGCFGRKMAYLELRLAIVLVLWHFKLQPVPEAYGSYDALDQLTHSPIYCYVKLEKA